MISLRERQIQALKDYTIDLYRRQGKSITNDQLNLVVNRALPEIKKGTSLYSGFTSPYRLEVKDKQMEFDQYVANYVLAQIDINLLTRHIEYMSGIKEYAFVYDEIVKSWSTYTLQKAQAILAKILLNTSEVVIGFVEKFITLNYIYSYTFNINLSEGRAYSHESKTTGVTLNEVSLWYDKTLYADLSATYPQLESGLAIDLDYVVPNEKFNLLLDLYFESDVSIFIREEEPFYYEIDNNGKKILTASGTLSVEGLAGTNKKVRLYPLPDKVEERFKYYSTFYVGMIDITDATQTIVSEALDMDYSYTHYKISIDPKPKDITNLTVQTYLLENANVDMGDDAVINELNWRDTNLDTIYEAVSKSTVEVNIDDDNQTEVKADMHTNSIRFYGYDMFQAGIVPEDKLEIESVIVGLDTFSKELQDEPVKYSGTINGPHESTLYDSDADTLEIPIKIESYFTVSQVSGDKYSITIPSPFRVRNTSIQIYHRDKEIPLGDSGATNLVYELDPVGTFPSGDYYYDINLYNADSLSMVKVVFVTYMSDLLTPNGGGESYSVESINSLTLYDSNDDVIYTNTDDLQDIGFNIYEGKLYVKSASDYSDTTGYYYTYDLEFSRKTPYYVYRLTAEMQSEATWSVNPLPAEVISNGGYISFNDELVSTSNSIVLSEGTNVIEILAPDSYTIEDLGIEYNNNDTVYGYGNAVYLAYSKFVKAVGVNDMLYYTIKYEGNKPVLVLPFHYKHAVDRIDRHDFSTLSKEIIDSIKVYVKYKLVDSGTTEYRAIAYRIRYSGYDQLILDEVKVAVA